MEWMRWLLARRALISARCKEFMETNEVALIELPSGSAIQKLSQLISNQKGLKQ
jgi:hypothetical protein